MHLAHAAKSMGYERPLADGSTHQTHYMGTDRYGRDVLSRLALGSRVSLSVGFIAVTIALFIGIPFGAIAGYYGGWTDRVLSSIIQVFWSIPTFLMVIALSFVLGKGYWQVFIAVGLTAWVEVASCQSLGLWPLANPSKACVATGDPCVDGFSCQSICHGYLA